MWAAHNNKNAPIALGQTWLCAANGSVWKIVFNCCTAGKKIGEKSTFVFVFFDEKSCGEI